MHGRRLHRGMLGQSYPHVPALRPRDLQAERIIIERGESEEDGQRQRHCVEQQRHADLGTCSRVDRHYITCGKPIRTPLHLQSRRKQPGLQRTSLRLDSHWVEMIFEGHHDGALP